MVDSGSTDSFVHPDVVEKSGLTVLQVATRETVYPAAASQHAKTQGDCFPTVSTEDECHSDVKLYVLPDLCANVILGQDWQSQHENVTIKHEGKKH